MTPLITVEEIVKSAFQKMLEADDEIEAKGDDHYAVVVKREIENVLTQDRQAIATALLTALEEKLLIEASFPNSKYTLEWKQGHNRGIEKAITIVKNLLTPTV